MNARGSLRTAATWVRVRTPSWSTLRTEGTAALPGAIARVPDGMASSVLAGVSPAAGLYASMVGPPVGGLTSSTKLMLVTTTSAAALATGSALTHVAPKDRIGAMALLVLLSGIMMIAAALLHAGRYTRFVSHSVMTGFLTGIAVNIALGQLPTLLGVHVTGGFALQKVYHLLEHPGRIELPSALTGAVAAVIVVVLARTRLRALAALVALVVTTAGVVLLGADSVARVRDLGAIPNGVPIPALPAFSQLSFSIFAGALAVTAIVLVQGAGVAQSAPNADGRPSDTNRDFFSQGAANLASSAFKGLPVGGSVGQTSLNVASGARTRWAGIISGVWMLLILLVFSSVIGAVPMPTLSALLIVAAVGAIRPGEIITILRTGPTSQVALIATFAATLFLPVAAAVGVGVALSLVLQLNQEAMDMRLVQIVPLPDGRFREQPAPPVLASREVTIVDIYGSLLYAGARTLEARLPDPAGSRRAAVIIRLRGRTQLGATFFLVIDAYAERLTRAGGRLFLSGLDEGLHAQYARSREQVGHHLVTVLAATDIIGESTEVASAEAREWIESGAPWPPDPREPPG